MSKEFNESEINQALFIIKNFKVLKTKKEIFYNMCFCILVPQARFKTILKVVDRLKKEEFYSKNIEKERMLELIKEARFKNRKADYLLELHNKFDAFWKDFSQIMNSDIDSRMKRDFLVKSIRGLGMKASSHLLRNLGVTDLAIIDTHILKYMGLKDKKFNYISIEDEIRTRAKDNNVSVAVFDAIIWARSANVESQQFVY